MHHCLDCGKTIDPRALRCRPCDGKRHRTRGLQDTAIKDATLLEWRGEGLTYSRIARRLGVQTVTAVRAVKRAKRRTALRASG
jgi:DNA-binding CsgD family transcriptional regulator